MTPSHPTPVNYVTDPGAGWGRRVPARSWLHSDAPRIDLSGEWRFRLLAGAPGTPGGRGVLPAGEADEAVADPAFDDSAWALMPVPAHWVLEGDGAPGPDAPYGRPIYTNVQYPFPTEPPFVPDANPTGDYRRRIELAEDVAGAERVLLRFEGVESRYRVWLNGVEIGVGAGSRLAQEFDVTGVARAGENVLVVRVHQWSAGSYLEDQDQWWLPGIFREVSILARPAGGLDDVWLRTAYDGPVAGPGAGRLLPEITASDAAFPVTLEIAELGVAVEWTSSADVTPLAIDRVEPWSAESPRLYEAVLRSAGGETVTQRVGFRTVLIDGDRFLVNGRRVVFHGVNRHETHPDRGRVFDEESARADLALMKRHNVNAIRTSHYPPHPRLLDLADEIGLWVILECDLETHGFERQAWVDNPSDDPIWREAYLDRIERTVERDKNHPSIVLWSLGNEAGTGRNLAAMSAWVHARDPERPVHYEGDYQGAYTDVYSRMYSSVPETESIGRDDAHSLLLGCSAAESARQRTKPFLLCEYVHAMGNGPGAIDQYEDLVDRYPRLHGGFVWEWRDHGLRTTTADGTEYFGYGGDFDEVVHDGNFVMDGLVLSDGTPSPGLGEYAAVVAPVRFLPDLSAGTLLVDNRRHDADTGDLGIVWRIEHDGVETDRGSIVIEPVAAGEAVTVRLPDAADAGTSAARPGETWLTIEAVLAADTAWAPAGHVVSSAQVEIIGASGGSGAPEPLHARVRPSSPSTARITTEPAARRELGPAVFEHGRLVELAGRPVSGPRPELWRAPTDNDSGGFGFGSYDLADPTLSNGLGVPAPSSAEVWRAAGLDRLEHRVLEVEESSDGVRVLTRSAAADRSHALLTEEHWRLVDGELILRVDLVPSAGWDIVLPRIGVGFAIESTIDRAEWFGLGPAESYPDSLRAARVGRYDATIDELSASYAMPQETGHRSGLRSLELFAGSERWLGVTADRDTRGRLPGFTLSRHTPQQIAVAQHPHELVRGPQHHLIIDAAQHGLGSRACGPDVWPNAILRPEARAITLRFV